MQFHHVLFLLASGVAADRLHLYRSDGCRNAKLGDYTPLEPGDCIRFDQARSYILEKDEDVTYNLYSGGGCGTYEGQVSVSTVCLNVGLDITGVMSIGRQDERSIRGATRPKNTVPKTLEKKQVDGDAWQCPNLPDYAPYFFVVLSSSPAVDASMSGPEQERLESDFMTNFHFAAQHPSGQTEVEGRTEGVGTDLSNPSSTLGMISGVVQDIEENEMRVLLHEFINFRRRQRGPVDFVVQIFSGRVTEHPGSPLALLQFNGWNVNLKA